MYPDENIAFGVQQQHFGCLSGIVPRAVIALHFFSAVTRPDVEVPTFLCFVLLILFVFFNIFAINVVLQYKQAGKWRSCLSGEIACIVLSLLA